MQKNLTPKQTAEILKKLETRFSQNMERHRGQNWQEILTLLTKNPNKLWSLNQMEETGGEPDMVVFNDEGNELFFIDCSAESPKGRRSLCYDRKALQTRKEHKPKNSAIDMAGEMGIEILPVEKYQKLQELGKFDQKSSSWVKTPEKIRKLGGALFCDRRYDTVFTYHNGAESYYAARGFRGMLSI